MPRATLTAVLALAALGCMGSPERASAPRPLEIDDAQLRAAAGQTQGWLTYGGSYAEQRYSALAKIDASNVKDLGLAWYFDTRMPRGHEATPIAVGGAIYTTGPWSVVFAIDARTGRPLWRHDPQVPRAAGALACCDVVNRGVAVYRGRVYAATLDGRLGSTVITDHTSLPVTASSAWSRPSSVAAYTRPR